MFNFGNMFDGMFAPVKNGMCKISMDGKIAIKTSTGFKTFDVTTKHLTNCSNFAFDMDGAFWIIPTMNVQVGDIVLVNGTPRAVLEVMPNSIKTFSSPSASAHYFSSLPKSNAPSNRFSKGLSLPIIINSIGFILPLLTPPNIWLIIIIFIILFMEESSLPIFINGLKILP